MGNNALMLIPKKVRKWALAHTRGGKVDKLEQLTKSLSQNTQLVKQKYGELTIVEQEVQKTLEQLRSETFSNEKKEIDALTLIPKEEKENFKNALIKIKEKGLKDLEPISITAQRIKAHMLVTLNKAQVQKAILIAKSRLASNANMQLETLKVIEKETKNINCDLKDLIDELNILNEGAINKFSDFQSTANSMIHEGDSNIIDTIFKKLENIPGKEKEKPEEVKKD